MPSKFPKLSEEAQHRLLSLWEALSAAKADEAQAKAERISIEEDIVELIDGPEHGSRTVTLEGGYKITVKREIGYKAKIDDLKAAIDQMNLELDENSTTYSEDFVYAPVKTKVTEEINQKAYEWYRQNRPDVFARLSEFVETSNRKPGVTIKAPKG